MWLATFGHFIGLAIEIVLGLAQCENTIIVMLHPTTDKRENEEQEIMSTGPSELIIFKAP